MLRKNYKGIIIGLILGLIFSNLIVFAETATKQINAVFNNIKLVVDGVTIEPKDASGNVVEPFIFNGTTYLPVRAVAQAFNKEVEWDGNTNTVYLGSKPAKPAKEVTLFDRSYISNTNPSTFKSREEKGENYISFTLDTWYSNDIVSYIDGNPPIPRKRKSESVTYPTNGLAKSIQGTLLPPKSGNEAREVIYRIYNESDKLLYTSPIMTPSTKETDFVVDITNCLSVRIEMELTATYSSGKGDCTIKNLTLTTTDY